MKVYTQWEEDKYITVQDGQVIDNEGNPFNLMTAKEEMLNFINGVVAK